MLLEIAKFYQLIAGYGRGVANCEVVQQEKKVTGKQHPDWGVATYDTQQVYCCTYYVYIHKCTILKFHTNTMLSFNVIWLV